jgi:hypothetical protein
MMTKYPFNPIPTFQIIGKSPEYYSIRNDIEIIGRTGDNMKPREIYCPECQYKTVSTVTNAKCGKCGHTMITIVKRHIEDGLVKGINSST